MSLAQRFAEAMGDLLGPDFPEEIALAVSGGGDSMAMLALAHGWARIWGLRLWVVTVDHGLRPESAREAEMVARECALLGHPHAVLRWHWDGIGNKMDAARRARLALIDAWRGRLRHVLLAHSRDDIAEGFLMRLARGAGGEGLAAMTAVRAVDFPVPVALPAGDVSGARPPAAETRAPMVLLRPCLGMDRAELRHYARVLKLPFVDDPSNDDPRFDRARMRRLLGLLEAEGLPRTALASAAERLREDRAVLRGDVARLWQAVGQAHDGWLSLAPDWAEGAAVATQRRLLALALRWVAGRDYAPRAEPLEALRDRLVSGGAGTLHGCEAAWIGGRLAVFREYAAVADLRAEAGLWDGRWRMPEGGAMGGAAPGAEIRALGEAGWRLLPAEARGPEPHRIARALPALWREGCPVVGIRPLWSAQAFARFVVTH